MFLHVQLVCLGSGSHATVDEYMRGVEEPNRHLLVIFYYFYVFIKFAV
jgi:predicted Na+-dependent transporter